MQRILPRVGLIVAGFQRSMGEEGGQGRHHGRQRCIGIDNLDPIRADQGVADRRLALRSKESWRIVPEALFRYKQGGGTDQLLQVLDAISTLFIVLIMGNQTARVDDYLDHFRQRQMLGLKAHALHQFDKRTQGRSGFTADVGHSCVHGNAVLSRCVLQLF